MKKVTTQPAVARDSDLQRAVEPLASYISATDHPRIALRRALDVLFREVQATDCIATVHVAALARIVGVNMNLAG